MLRLWILVVLGLALCADWTYGENAPAPPPRPPCSAVVGETDKSKNIIMVAMPEVVTEVRMCEWTEEIEVDGKKMTVKNTVPIPVTSIVMSVVPWDVEKGIAVNGAGKKLSKDDLFKQLKTGDKVLIYFTNKVDPMDLKGLKDDVVLLKMQQRPAMVAPQPVPPKKPEPIPPQKQ